MIAERTVRHIYTQAPVYVYTDLYDLANDITLHKLTRALVASVLFAGYNNF